MRLCSRLAGKRKPRPGLGVAAFSPKQPAARRRRWRRAHFGFTGLKPVRSQLVCPFAKGGLLFLRCLRRIQFPAGGNPSGLRPLGPPPGDGKVGWDGLDGLQSNGRARALWHKCFRCDSRPGELLSCGRVPRRAQPAGRTGCGSITCNQRIIQP